MADIIEKFEDLPQKQASIARIVNNKYFKARTFKKRQLFILMCKGQMM